MSLKSPTLHMMCGKIAAGKSTLAVRLGAENGALVLAEDDWLVALYADEMRDLADYVRCAAKLRAIMEPHVIALLQAGVSVVLDFPANTVGTRAWMRRVLAASGAEGRLHVLEVADAICLERLRVRNAGGDHPFAATEAQFHRMSAHFELPAADEGFVIERHAPAD